MKILFLVLLSVSWIEDFSSSERAQQAWQGDWDQVSINAHEQLQNHVDTTATSCLRHPSYASLNAEWSFYTRIYGGTSTYNQTRFYLLTADSLTADGYYIQVGGNTDNITLYQIQNGQNKQVIESAYRQHILPQDDAEVYVRLTRGDDGVFHLYSWVEGVDVDFQEEGTCYCAYLPSQYVALYMKNSSQRGHDLYFDDIRVTGDAQTEALSQAPSPVSLNSSSDYLSLHHEGHDSEVHITYTVPDDTYKAHMRVYSADGRLIRTCYQQQALSTSGELTWDGQDNHGCPVEIGVYVLIIDITSPTQAPVRKRFPIAVIY